jgi:hypothetical protein
MLEDTLIAPATRLRLQIVRKSRCQKLTREIRNANPHNYGASQYFYGAMSLRRWFDPATVYQSHYGLVS